MFILDKIKGYFNLKSNKELADFLGVTKQTISNWYSRNSIDYDIVISKCTLASKDIDLRWLLSNNDEKQQDAPNPAISKKMYDTDDETYSILKVAEGKKALYAYLLKITDYETQSKISYDLFSLISNINEHICDMNIYSKFDSLYEDFKENKISEENLFKEFNLLIKNDKKISEILIPYKRELNAINDILMLHVFYMKDDD